MTEFAMHPTKSTYERLQQAFDYFNAELFEHVLPRVVLTMQRRPRTRGYFAPQRFASRQGERRELHEIALNPATFPGRSDRAILSTLVHEMCHLWQQCYGQPGRRGYHNRAWSGQMLSIGLHPSGTGQPGGRMVGERVSHYIIEGGRFALTCADLLADGFALTCQDDRQPRQVTVPTGAQKQSTGRVAFRCPGCGLRAWAKPAARLSCADCKLLLLATVEWAGSATRSEPVKTVIEIPG